ncbi:phospholipase D-like protein [Propionicimonas paludicola]|uniref:Phospholipase D-like protein n=1 Tax=Propionicimonas paludicola TaxID=185243 RepID=A0A2A9CPD9_9ACTN|nr:PLDc N-terminal domain-containing protein [Propionicimonas paludicola]PFG16016.1 phospholipase D-like protein [Propionicimonas paludicola]
MLRVLPVIAALLLLVFSLVDCAQSPDARVRNLPKWVWLLLILLVPLAGPIAWLFGGRPIVGTPPKAPTAAPRPPRAPDDDPDFLAKLKPQADHERLLNQWEADLRRREAELRETEDQPPDQTPEA